MFRALLVSLVITLPLGLGACGSGGFARQSTAAVARKAAGFGVSNLFPARVKIVKAREKDLKELPLGHERAVAFEKQRKFGLWTFGGAVNFIQPDLPEPGAEMDGSLLPPKTP
jgi:hypothetical protein